MAPGVETVFPISDEAGQCDADRAGHIDREARNSRDRDDGRDSGAIGFLDDLEAHSPAHLQDTSVQRKELFEQGGPYCFVYGVVTTDVLAKEEELSLRIEYSSGVQGSGALE